MQIENIHTTNAQFYTHIIEYGKRYINYTPMDRTVIFRYKNKTYKIECNPLLIEDTIKEYIKKEGL